MIFQISPYIPYIYIYTIIPISPFVLLCFYIRMCMCVTYIYIYTLYSPEHQFNANLVRTR